MNLENDLDYITDALLDLKNLRYVLRRISTIDKIYQDFMAKQLETLQSNLERLEDNIKIELGYWG